MEPIESSETSAYINTLTPGAYPKEKKLQDGSCGNILWGRETDRSSSESHPNV